jgi:hypothetical protein
MHHDRGVLQAAMKEFLVRLDYEGRRDASFGIRQHAVFGHDGEAFDTGRTGHAWRQSLSE